MKEIYIGGLPLDFTTKDLYDLFAPYGRIESVIIASDGKTGEKKDFGFIQMFEENAVEAVKNLKTTKIGGRSLRIELSKASV